MANNMLEVEGLKKYFSVGAGITNIFKPKEYVKALDDVSLTIKEGEIFGLAGESGSGKSTIGEILLRLQEPTEGKITLDGDDFTKLTRKDEKKFRREVQMIFQDPYETLNPRFTIYQTVAEPLLIHKLGDENEIYDRVVEALETAELRPAEKYLNQYPHELSGGQRQRVAIARGIVLEPKFLVADEPVSMLDVSIRAGILNLLGDLRDELGLTMVYISHDLSTIKYLCDRIAILYLGKIMEIGPTDEVIMNPRHPYTKTLLSAVPVPDPDVNRKRIALDDEVANQIDIPQGCRFKPRCSMAKSECIKCNHKLKQVGEDHYSACVLD
ncbi:ABC transporter ATP-binding protein [Natroniella sp. ANB-PHB2]|uniref:ABC transporter ATP-binding protein n=1 Tax=Natroniella sp. ANB-PHB2 TaxID=3384444 RepID=UPI0038D4F4CA